MAHAFLGPSGAHRWLRCTMAPVTEKLFPDDVKSYMAEGTLAHSFAEIAARRRVCGMTEEEHSKLRNELIASDAGQLYYSAEMDEAAEQYASLIEHKLAELTETDPSAFVLLEQRVDIGRWVPESFGTADCLILSNSHIEVIDFKYGLGHRVSAKGNEQMRLYALGALNEFEYLYEPEFIGMTIFQPRLSDRPSSDAMLRTELLQWAETEVKPRALKAFTGEGDYDPGEDTCKFCKARRQCRARFEFNLKVIGGRKAIVDADEAAAVLAQADDISGWLKDLESLVFDTLSSGQPVTGFKLVRGTSRRKLVSEEIAVQKIIQAGLDPERMYEKKMKGLTALESEFGKKSFTQMMGENIFKPEGKPTLAKESDKRPSIAEEMFDM